jgi:PAS domain S-box-containing protein
MHATKEVKRGLSDPADALQRIDTVLRLSRSAIWEVDRQGIFTYASASHEDLLGYRPEEVVGIRSIDDFYPADLRREVAEDWIGAGEEFSDVELPLVAKSGEIVWVASHGAPIFGERGEVIGFRGVDTDITARRRAEEELRRHNERMRLAARAGGIGFWEHDYITDREDWDDGMLEIYGIRREDFRGTGSSWLELVHPEDRAALRSAEEQARQEGEPVRNEFRIIRPDGEVRRITSLWTVVCDASGRPVRKTGVNQDVTARHLANRMLEQSEEKFRLMIESAPVAVSYTDRATGRVYFNAAHEALLGYRRDEEWTREKLTERIAAGVGVDFPLVAWDEMKGAARERGELLRMEAQLTASDGSVRDVELTRIPLPGVDFNLMVDLTERKRVLQDLQESGRRLRAVVENTPVPISYTLAGGTAVHLNKAFTEVYGWAEKDMPTVDVWFEKAYPDPVYRQEVLARWEEDVKRARSADGTLAPRLYRIAAKDGSMREVEISAVIFEGEMFGTFLDLTERNRTERLLRESEEQLLGLIDNAPLGVVRLDLTSGRLHSNKAFTEILGYTADDIQTMDGWLHRAYPDEAYRSRIRADWLEALSHAQSHDGRIEATELRVTDKAGREHEMQFSGLVLGGEMFGLFVDLTERNRAERLLREQGEQLAHVGRVSALGQLAASLAHELDQPLGAILNNAETARLILEKKKPDLAELRAIVRDILDDDRRAGEVLDRIRSMLQKQPFKPVRVELSELLREVAALVQPVVRKRRIKLEKSCEPGLPTVEGDYVLLQQALLNLILNSVDAIGPRTDGHIGLWAGEMANGGVEITVGDNGGGMSVSDKERMLEPFYTTKEGGLGMGLPIVKSIVDQHGGKLRVDNQHGRGLAVYLQLPGWREPGVS